MKLKKPSPGKRAFDLLTLVLIVPFALPVGVLIGLAVFLDSPGPVFFRARRVGGQGRSFEMLKFRTMRVGMAGHAVAGGADERITPVGRFLRNTRLDELPQLWNVLRGQMSIVGPRPELEEFVALHADDYREILSVPPGITGPTQLRFAGVEAGLLSLQPDPEAYYRAELLPGKVALDLAYARSCSLRTDFSILCRTLPLPAILVWQRLRGEDEGSPPGDRMRSVAYTGFAMGVVALPIVFALGLGSPR
jgi:lipopolysaccharide/colanic/teichoic acid biosynthesis glycosyltransferase